MNRDTVVADRAALVSDAFQVFMRECPSHAKAWTTAVGALAAASALDAKTQTLAYLAVLAAPRVTK